MSSSAGCVATFLALCYAQAMGIGGTSESRKADYSCFLFQPACVVALEVLADITHVQLDALFARGVGRSAKTICFVLA